MDLDEIGLSALANFADAVVNSPADFDVLAAAAIDDARRFDSRGNASALVLAIEVVARALDAVAPEPRARTLQSMVEVARTLRGRQDRLASEAGRALIWALENQLLVAARADAKPLPAGLQPADEGERERSRPISIRPLEGY